VHHSSTAHLAPTPGATRSNNPNARRTRRETGGSTSLVTTPSPRLSPLIGRGRKWLAFEPFSRDKPLLDLATSLLHDPGNIA
jgi:hypothetical protein